MIFGKALDTVSGYDTKSGAALGYADKNAVSAAAVPYLELLYRADLMVGDSDNKFNPKANITRAEMAVLSVKTYNKLTEKGSDVTVPVKESVTAGTVTTSSLMQNGDLFLTVKTNAGTNLSLFGAKGDVKPKYNGETISFADATPSLAQAIKMRSFSKEGKLSKEVIESIISEEKPNKKEKISFRIDKLRKHIPATVPMRQTEEYVLKALEYYTRYRENMRSSRDR